MDDDDDALRSLHPISTSSLHPVSLSASASSSFPISTSALSTKKMATNNNAEEQADQAYTMTIDPPTPGASTSATPTSLQSILLPSPVANLHHSGTNSTHNISHNSNANTGNANGGSGGGGRKAKHAQVEWEDGVRGGSVAATGRGKGKGRAAESPNGSTMAGMNGTFSPTTNGRANSAGHAAASLYASSDASTSSTFPPSFPLATSSFPPGTSTPPSNTQTSDANGYTCICSYTDDDGGVAIQCSACGVWCHQFCFGLAPGDVGEDEPWYCWRCDSSALLSTGGAGRDGGGAYNGKERGKAKGRRIDAAEAKRRMGVRMAEKALKDSASLVDASALTPTSASVSLLSASSAGATAGTSGGGAGGGGRGKRKASPSHTGTEKKRRTAGGEGKKRRRASVVGGPGGVASSISAGGGDVSMAGGAMVVDGGSGVGGGSGEGTSGSGVGSGSGGGEGSGGGTGAGGQGDTADIEESWSSGYVHISEDIVQSEETRRALQRQAARWRGVSAFVTPPPVQVMDPTGNPAGGNSSSNLRITLLSPSSAVHPSLSPSPSLPSTSTVNNALSSRPPLFGAHTKRPFAQGECVERYTSVITPSSVYVGERTNGYAGMGVPKPFVRLVGGSSFYGGFGSGSCGRKTGGKEGKGGEGEGMEDEVDEAERGDEDMEREEGWALDARMAGNEARFVRSGCRPNAVLRPVLCRSPLPSSSGPPTSAGTSTSTTASGASGSSLRKGRGGSPARRRGGKGRVLETEVPGDGDDEGGEDALKFGIFATRDLKEGEEVVLAWEWDDGNVVRTLPAMVECPGMFSSRLLPPSSPTQHSDAQIEHARRQIANIVHTLGSTFSTCACGARARECAFSVFSAFVDGSLPIPRSHSPSSYPNALSYPQVYPPYPEAYPHSYPPGSSLSPYAAEGPYRGGGGGSQTTSEDESGVPVLLRRKKGGPLAGLAEKRGFRAREVVPFSGGLGGVEVVGAGLGSSRDEAGSRGKGKERAVGEWMAEDERERRVRVGERRGGDGGVEDVHENSALRIHSNEHPHIPISDDRDLRPPDPPPGDSMDVDDADGASTPKPVEETYMPPKMRKKLRNRLLEDLRTNERAESPLIVIDGDGVPVPAAAFKPPTSASPSASFAKLSLITPRPISADPISMLFSPPSQAESPCPSPSPLKTLSRIPVSDVRDEPPPPLSSSTQNERERTATPTTPTKQASAKAKSSKKAEPSKPSPKKPASKAKGRKSRKVVVVSESEPEEEEGEVPARAEEEESAMDVDLEVEVCAKEASPIPDTPASPSPPPASPSDRPSTAESTPPPPPPSAPVSKAKATLKPQSASAKAKKKETANPASKAKSKKMDVHSLVNSEASTPNIGEKKVLGSEREDLGTDIDAEVKELPSAEDVEMGEIQEEPIHDHPVEEKAKSPVPQEPEPVKEPTPPPAAKSPSPPPPKAPTPPPPPPPKVKLSLKDFAARRKKQKEEEKHRVDEGATPTASGPSFASGPPANGMSKAIKLEQVQEAMMRPDTPTTSGDEFGIPGLTMSPRTKAALVASKARSASISTLVSQSPSAPTPSTKPPAAGPSSPPFKSIMDVKSPAISSVAPPPSVAAMAMALSIGPSAPSASTSLAPKPTPVPGGKAPIAPKPIPPKSLNSIPPRANSISSVLRAPSPPTASLTTPFSNLREASNQSRLRLPRSGAQYSPAIPSHSPAPTTAKQPPASAPNASWPQRSHPASFRTPSNAMEDDAVSLGDSEEGSIPPYSYVTLPHPRQGPHAPQSASSTTSFATQQGASPPPSTAGSYASSASTASFSSAVTYRAPTPSNRAPTPSNGNGSGIPTGPASMRTAQIPDGPRRASLHAPQAPQPQPNITAGKPPTQPRATASIPYVAYTRVQPTTTPTPSAATAATSTPAQPKKLPTGPASLIYGPRAPPGSGGNANSAAASDPLPRKLSPVTAPTNPRSPNISSISHSNSNSSVPSASSRPIPVGPRSGLYNAPPQPHSQQSNETQGHARRGSTGTPPLPSTPSTYESAYDREKEGPYGRRDSASYGPASSGAWRSPPRYDAPTHTREWGERQQPPSQPYRRDEGASYRQETSAYRDEREVPRPPAYAPNRAAPPTMPRAERMRMEQMQAQREAQSQSGRGQWER